MQYILTKPIYEPNEDENYNYKMWFGYTYNSDTQISMMPFFGKTAEEAKSKADKFIAKIDPIVFREPDCI